MVTPLIAAQLKILFLIAVNAACDTAQRAAYQGASSKGASGQGADAKACAGSDGTAGQGSLLRAGHVRTGGSAQKHQYHERGKYFSHIHFLSFSGWV
jgi:hypothetical protein